MAARVTAQLLSFAWFVLVVREFSRQEFGEVGAAITLVMVVSALAELGVNRTIVRHVAVGVPARPTLVAALRCRVIGGVVVGPIVLIAALVLGSPVPLQLVVLAGALSLVSGWVDAHFAVLRAVGTVVVEAIALVAERGVFLVAALVILGGGGGPLALMGAYLATNTLTAVVVSVLVRRRLVSSRQDAGTREGAAVTGHAGPMLDAEGRRTAVLGSLALLVPRIAAIGIAIGGTASAAGGFGLVARPVDALLVLGSTALLVVHPEARRRVVRGRTPEARRLCVIAGGLLAGGVLLAAVVVLSIREWVVRTLAGDDGYADVAEVLVALMVIAAISLWRQAGEVQALAEQRAGSALASGFSALVAGTLALLVLLPAHGMAGAVAAQAVAEIVGAVVVWAAVFRSRRVDTQPATLRSAALVEAGVR